MSIADAMSLPQRNPHKEIAEGELVNWLAQSKMFDGLNEGDLRLFFKDLQILNFKPMDEAISQDQYSSALYIVSSGRFLVLRSTASNVHHAISEDDLIELDTFSKGQCFGEYSLMDRQPASASVVAAERSQAIRIPRAVFDEVMMSDYRIAKTVYYNLVLILTERLRKSLKV